VEKLGVVDRAFWNGRRVFITGHTGFKGSWLSLWLQRLSAIVTGYALSPPTEPSLFELAAVANDMTSKLGDVRDLSELTAAMESARPEVVFHLAAQPIVRRSYREPVTTFSTNVLGTVNVLEAIRRVGSICAAVIITSDKCYENDERDWSYREDDRLGGYEPYSSSKACSELVVAAYRNSFFNPETFARHGTTIASARAGNVIGGGDWAEDRLVPDLMRGFLAGETVLVRSPDAKRPWQHVLVPLSGYLVLAQQLITAGPAFGEAWNFAPPEEDSKPVAWIADRLSAYWGGHADWKRDQGDHPHEAQILKLDWSKAREKLHWRPRWDLDRSLQAIVTWYKGYGERPGPERLRRLALDDIEAYEREGP
jgi:CDP-glucose 4,6-dehydratase